MIANHCHSYFQGGMKQSKAASWTRNSGKGYVLCLVFPLELQGQLTQLIEEAALGQEMESLDILVQRT